MYINASRSIGLFYLTFLITSCGGENSTPTPTPEPQNTAPIIQSANEATIEENSSGVFYTANATDADVDTLTYSISGEDEQLFQIDPNSGALSFISSPDFETPSDSDLDNTYSINIHVTDGQGGEDLQALMIEVSDVFENTPPHFTSNNEASIPENTAGVIYIATADDTDNQHLDFAIYGGEDQEKFQINSSTGELQFRVPQDFEVPEDTNKDNIYKVQLLVSDTELASDIIDLDIQITDVQELTLTIVDYFDICDEPIAGEYEITLFNSDGSREVRTLQHSGRHETFSLNGISSESLTFTFNHRESTNSNLYFQVPNANYKVTGSSHSNNPTCTCETYTSTLNANSSNLNNIYFRTLSNSWNPRYDSGPETWIFDEISMCEKEFNHAFIMDTDTKEYVRITKENILSPVIFDQKMEQIHVSFDQNYDHTSLTVWPDNTHQRNEHLILSGDFNENTIGDSQQYFIGEINERAAMISVLNHYALDEDNSPISINYDPDSTGFVSGSKYVNHYMPIDINITSQEIFIHDFGEVSFTMTDQSIDLSSSSHDAFDFITMDFITPDGIFSVTTPWIETLNLVDIQKLLSFDTYHFFVIAFKSNSADLPITQGFGTYDPGNYEESVYWIVLHK